MSDFSELEVFYEEGWITDVLNMVKRGKEATVYLCQADPLIGTEFLAAKIYRPRQFRSFKNDAIYQEGRVIVDARLRRAVRKKTRTGRQVQFSSWVEHEFETLGLLYAAGADVPRPFARSGNAVLMEYIGDAQISAQMLHNVSLAPDEVQPLFNLIMDNVELWLACYRVHADLSAFNILYWEGNVKIIDFPQSVDPRSNQNAFSLLARDISNVCRYWERYGVQANPSRLAEKLWRRYLRAEL